MIKNANKKTIVWTMPRTASSALIKELVTNNNLSIMPNHWEPLSCHGDFCAARIPLSKILVGTVGSNYSFKVMCNLEDTYDKHPDDLKYNGLNTLKELMSNAKIADYRNIFLFRQDTRMQLRSFAFSVITDVWNPFGIKLSDERMIEKIGEAQIDSVIEDCYDYLAAAMTNMDTLYTEAGRLDSVQVYETKDVIDYASPQWSQGTNHLYHLVDHEIYEDKLQKRLEGTCFYNDYFAN